MSFEQDVEHTLIHEIRAVPDKKMRFEISRLFILSWHMLPLVSLCPLYNNDNGNNPS